MTVISNDVAAAGLTGSFVAGATALQLRSIGAQLTRGVQIKNPSTNAGTLYVGFDPHRQYGQDMAHRFPGVDVCFVLGGLS